MRTEELFKKALAADDSRVIAKAAGAMEEQQFKPERVIQLIEEAAVQGGKGAQLYLDQLRQQQHQSPRP